MERLRDSYGGPAASDKLALLGAFEKKRLARASEVGRLHEVLCFLRAHPDDSAVLAGVERMLAAFARRSDLRRHRAALADTGIAGTEIRCRLFHPTAVWLARRWPQRLLIDWERFGWQEELEVFLPLMVHFAETPGLDEWEFGVRGWLRRLKGRHETDAAFLVRRFESLRADRFLRERLWDNILPPMRLVPDTGTPSRTLSRYSRSPIIFVRGGLARGRPALPADAAREPLDVRDASPRQARELIELAREAMVTRQRDLDVFSYASAADVRLVDWEEGLQFACFGAVPERRLLLEAVYGFLTLKNGVPIGYVLVSALFGSSEIAYNVFDTWRGGESGTIYGRVLATARRLFGSDAFTIFPYQLGGYGNEEALRSGAWWFYQKIGFRPRSGEALRLMRRELGVMRRSPGHRSNRATLAALGAHNMYYFLGQRRSDVLGIVFTANVGLRVSERLAARFGARREEAARTCSREAGALVGLRTPDDLPAGERLAWHRWAPLVCLLPGIGQWSNAERRALFEVIRAKGGRRESDFVALFDAHRRLRRAIVSLARQGLTRGS